MDCIFPGREAKWKICFTASAVSQMTKLLRNLKAGLYWHPEDILQISQDNKTLSPGSGNWCKCVPSPPIIPRHISLKISIFPTFTSVPLVSQFLKRVTLLLSTHIMFSSLLPFSEVGRLVFWRRDFYMPLVLFGFLY